MPNETIAAQSSRKRLNHRGPLSIDVASAWYFITICADGHAPWVGRDDHVASVGRDDPIAPICRPDPIASVGRDDPIASPNPIAPRAAYDAILSTARHFQTIGKWNLALLLVMPDHVHFIVNVPCCGAMWSSHPTGLERVIQDFKRSISRLFGIRFQRDFFDTRLRNDAHFAEKYNYILDNPVRKGLCAAPSDWPHSIAFTRDGVEISAWRTDSASVGRDDPIAPLCRPDPIAPSARHVGRTKTAIGKRLR